MGLTFPIASIAVVYPEFEPTMIVEELPSISELMGIPTMQMEPDGNGNFKALDLPIRLWTYPGRHTPMPPPKRYPTEMDSNVLHQDENPPATEYGKRPKRPWEIEQELKSAWQAHLHVQQYDEPSINTLVETRNLNAQLQVQHEVKSLEQVPFNLSNMYRKGNLSDDMTYEQLIERLSEIYYAQKRYDQHNSGKPVFLWNFDPKCLDSRPMHIKIKQQKLRRTNENDPLRIWRDAISRAAMVLKMADDKCFWDLANKKGETLFIDCVGAPKN